MTKARWLAGASLAVLLVAPALADDDSQQRFALLEDGFIESDEIPLVSIATGRDLGTVHFRVVGFEPGPDGFAIATVWNYDLGPAGSLSVDPSTLWCSFTDAEPEPDASVVCNGEGVIAGGTGAFENAGGRVTRRVQIFEGSPSRVDRGFSLFEIDRHD